MGNSCSDLTTVTDGQKFIECLSSQDDEPNQPAGANLKLGYATILGGRAGDFQQPVYDWYIQYLTGKWDPEVGLAGLNYLSVNQYLDLDGVKVGVLNYNLLRVAFFVATRQRLIDLCGEENWTYCWPHFYHNYNSYDGKKQVDAYLEKTPNLPAAAVAALKLNYTEEIQRRYQLLNVPDGSTTILFDGQNLCGGNGIGYADNWTGPSCPQEWGAAQLVYDPNKWLLHTMAASVDEWNKGKTYGNPLWSHKDRQWYFAQIIGDNWRDGVPFIDQWAQSYVDFGFLDPGKSAVDYFDPAAQAGKTNPFTDPDYLGALPYLPPENVDSNEPWHLSTQDPNQYGYVNPCLQKNGLDELLPVVAAGAAGVLAIMGVPGKWAKVVGGGTAAITAASFTGATLGWAAMTGNSNGKVIAAEVLSIGAPATVILSIAELGILPEALSTRNAKIAMMSAAGLCGYVLLLPIVRPVLVYGGDAITIATAPLSFLEGVITYFWSGCAGHQITLNRVCDCEVASNKPNLQDALLYIYGVTDQQLVLRKQALQARMTAGTWGPDPVAIGSCNSDGHMDNFLACISAGEWGYNTWPSEFNPAAQTAWNEIADIFDPDNPSFLPPKDSDADCLQNGKYFRKDKDGTCKDFRAPLGQQGPGQYLWPGTQSNESCIIL